MDEEVTFSREIIPIRSEPDPPCRSALYECFWLLFQSAKRWSFAVDLSWSGSCWWYCEHRGLCWRSGNESKSHHLLSTSPCGRRLQWPWELC